MGAASKAKAAVILLAEDDRGDQELTRRALEQGKIRNELRVVEDGEEALAYLYRRGKYKDPATSPRPDLLLLDLNLPRVDGRQVLEKVRSDSRLRRMAVARQCRQDRRQDLVVSQHTKIGFWEKSTGWVQGGCIGGSFSEAGVYPVAAELTSGQALHPDEYVICYIGRKEYKCESTLQSPRTPGSTTSPPRRPAKPRASARTTETRTT